MKKINTLTEEQERRLIEFREGWRSVGLQSGRADVERFRPAINLFYDKLGKKPPHVWRCESPMTANLIINIISAVSGDNLGANLGANLWNNLRDNLGANLGGNLWDNLGDNLRDNLWDNLGDNLGDNLWDNLGGNLRANLLANIGGTKYISTYMWGNQDSYWIAYYLFPHEVLRPMHTTDQAILLNAWGEIARSCSWWYPYENIVFVCDRPETKWDERWMLHSESGPAVAFPDGYNIYAIHGVVVPRWVVTNPELLSWDKIQKEKNAEVRRIMMARYGWERVLSEVNPVILDTHPDPTIGTLYEFDDNGTKYHIALVKEHRSSLFPARTYAIRTRTSINKIVPSLKDTYPIYRNLSDDEYLSIPRT